MSALERAISDLAKTESQFATEALASPADKTEFGYGFSCGMYQALKLARSILERALADSDPHRAERHSK